MPAVSACSCSLQLDDGMQCAEHRPGGSRPLALPPPVLLPPLLPAAHLDALPPPSICPAQAL